MQLLELVERTKPIVCSIFALFYNFFIKTHILSSQTLSNFDLKLAKDTAFTTSKGRLFQLFMTLILKKCLCIASVRKFNIKSKLDWHLFPVTNPFWRFVKSLLLTMYARRYWSLIINSMTLQTIEVKLIGL